jgi:hypothetical protein
MSERDDKFKGYLGAKIYVLEIAMGPVNMFLNIGKGPRKLRAKVKKCDGRRC